MRSIYSILLLVGGVFWVSCKKNPMVFEYEVSTGLLPFTSEMDTTGFSEVIIGPINMDSIIKASLQTDINRIGVIETYFKSAQLIMLIQSSKERWPKGIRVSLNCFDNQFFIAELLQDFTLADTINRPFLIYPSVGKNLSSVFIHKKAVFFQLKILDKQKHSVPMPGNLMLNFKIKMVERVNL